MGDKPIFSYFTGQESEMLSFYRVPKLLMTSAYFKEISSDAKLLYGLALDRMSLSLKNGWFDNENRAYIYFSIEEVAELLNCGKNKAVKSMQELEAAGLIEKRRQGMGKSNVLYVKNFVIENGMQDFSNQTSMGETEDKESHKTKFLNITTRDSKIPQSKIPEVYDSGSNKNKSNNTDFSENNSNLILSMEDRMGGDEYSRYAQMIKENISLDILLERYPYEQELITGIFDLILETVLCQSDQILIASNRYPTELVKSKLLKLNSGHVEYVMDGLKSNTSKVRNIKKYLLAALFNAPTTISGYYQALVNYDMPQFAQSK